MVLHNNLLRKKFKYTKYKLQIEKIYISQNLILKVVKGSEIRYLNVTQYSSLDFLNGE